MHCNNFNLNETNYLAHFSLNKKKWMNEYASYIQRHTLRVMLSPTQRCYCALLFIYITYLSCVLFWSSLKIPKHMSCHHCKYKIIVNINLLIYSYFHQIQWADENYIIKLNIILIFFYKNERMFQWNWSYYDNELHFTNYSSSSTTTFFSNQAFYLFVVIFIWAQHSQIAFFLARKLIFIIHGKMFSVK